MTKLRLITLTMWGLALWLAGTACTEKQKADMERRHQEDVQRWNEFWGTKPGGEKRSASGRLVGETETWTIECNAYEGENAAEMADRMATALKRVQDLDGNRVWVQHEENRSRVFYGSYDLKYVTATVDGDEHAQGDVIIQLSSEIKQDLRFIKTLAFGDQYPFFSARAIPKPIEDVGPPEWDLRKAKGVYTLHVGVTYNTPSLHNYKQAAVEWVKDLRRRGFEAYYYHDPDKPQTSICVGTFGEDAVTEYEPSQQPGEPKTTPRRKYSNAVLQLRDTEEFKWNLENGHKVWRGTTAADGSSARMVNESFLVKIPTHDSGSISGGDRW